MRISVSSLGQGPGLAWKRGSSSFPHGSLGELQEWTGGKTDPPEPPWHGEVDFQQWNTIGWGITDDGVLCIKPWNGDTGETGSTITDEVPWYDQASKIRKVESTGTIALNEASKNLFSDCSDLTDLAGLADWNVSNVASMSGMFYGCSSLTDLTGLSGWNVSNAMYMGSMFYDCSSLTDLTALEDWNVSSVESMGNMFYNCSSLTDLTALEDWNVSNVEYMRDMFYGCSSLTDLSAIKNWNVSNVTEMDSMFWDCSSLQRIGIPSIANGGMKLVENADRSGIAYALPWIISEEDESMRSYTWDELNIEMTTNPERFESGTVWVKEAE